MKIIQTCLIMMFAFAGLLYGAVPAAAMKENSPLTAAFVRNGDLWMKTGEHEKRQAGGPFVRNPKWSFDGNWIAYTKGEEQQELRVLNVRTGRSSLVSAQGGRNFQWAPNAEMLAYQTDRLLQFVEMRRPDMPLGAAEGIGNYSWLPDGKGFFASSQSELLADGWTPVSLYRIPLETLGDPGKYVTVHVLPKQSDDFFAVGTSVFKWSADGRWIAFLATPTASLSADSNTLCLLTTDGVVFRTIDEMVNNNQWFEWAAAGDRLAYIAGIGREAGRNKRLKVIAAASEKSASYTPNGYADQSLSWQGPGHIVVSRAAEMESGSSTAKRRKPFLTVVELSSGKQARLTKPPGAFGDYNPISLDSKLAWIRYDRRTANVIVANAKGRHAVVWIRNIDPASDYYEQWMWGEVLQFERLPGLNEIISVWDTEKQGMQRSVFAHDIQQNLTRFGQ